jgi:OOP family OmpA-OmpF porin
MVSPIRRFSGMGLVILAGMMVLSGCATRKFVTNQIQGLDPKFQEINNAAKENAERIDGVDRKAQQGITAAGAADTKAGAAQTAAQTAQAAAQAADRKADQANTSISTTNTNVTRLETRINNLVTGDAYAESDKQVVTFDTNKATLSNMAKSTLDKVAGDLSGMRSGYMVELQGYTDGQGSEQYNIGLSQRRAESVERYLVSKNVPLYRVSILGLGKDNPVADNKSKDGRAQNRRVEVRVLKQAAPGRQTN